MIVYIVAPSAPRRGKGKLTISNRTSRPQMKLEACGNHLYSQKGVDFMKKRLISTFLALSLVASMTSPGALAAGRQIGGPDGGSSSSGTSSPIVKRNTSTQQPSTITKRNLQTNEVTQIPVNQNTQKSASFTASPTTSGTGGEQASSTTSSTTTAAPASTIAPVTITKAVTVPNLAGAGTSSVTLTATNGVYQLGTLNELRAFAVLANGGEPAANAALTADISLTTAWTPIGTAAKPYTGTFTGNGHTVSGLGANGALFGYLGEGGVIQGVKVSSGKLCQNNKGKIDATTPTVTTPDTTTTPGTSTTTPGTSTTAPGASTTTPGTSATTPGTSTTTPGSTITTPDTSATTPGTSTATPDTTTTAPESSKATFTPATATCEIGKSVMVTVENAAPNSSVLLSGPIGKSVDVGADGKATLTIDTADSKELFTPANNAASQDFAFTLKNDASEIGTFTLTVTNPDAPKEKPAQTETVSNTTTKNEMKAPAQIQKVSYQYSASAANTSTDAPAAQADDKTNLSKATVTIEVKPQVYTGSSIKPKVDDITLIVDGKRVMVKEDTFSITCQNCTNVSDEPIIEIKATPDNESYTGECVGEFEITPAPLTIVQASAKPTSRAYNGKKTINVSFDVDGAKNPDQITVSAVGTLPSPDAGTYTTVDFSNESFSLSGLTSEKAANYSVTPVTTVNLTPGVEITKAEISSIMVTVKSKPYDSLKEAEIDNITFAMPNGLPAPENFDASAEYTSSAINTKTATATISLKGTDAQNYTFSATNVTVTVSGNGITAATPKITSAEVESKVYDGTTTAALVQDSVKLSPALKPETISAVYDSADAGTKQFTVTVTLSSSDVTALGLTSNTITQTFTTAGNGITKAVPSITWPTLTSSTISYGKTLSSLLPTTGTDAGSVTGVNGSIPGTFKWNGNKDMPDASSAAQTFTMTFEPTDSHVKQNYTLDNTNNQHPYTITVNPAAPDLTALPTTATIPYGKTLSSITDDEKNPIKAINPNNNQAIEGRWVWGSSQNNLIPETSAPYDVKFEPTNASNYADTAAQSVSVTVGKAVPTITLTPADKSTCKSGSSVTVTAEAANPYSKNVTHPPVINEITYQFGSDDTPHTIPSNYTLKIPDDLVKGTSLILTATTTEDNYYTTNNNSNQAIHTITVDNRNLVNVTAESDGWTYDGTSTNHTGYKSVIVTNGNGSPVQSLNIQAIYYPAVKTGNNYTKNGAALDDVPVDAGDYIVDIVASDNNNVSNPYSVGFTVEKKQLYWSANGNRSAYKNVGSTEEASVNGTLNVYGICDRDRNSVTFTQPSMVTSGFNLRTEQGIYDVDIVPASGTWASCFTPANPANYILPTSLPTGNPKAAGYVGVAVESGTNRIPLEETDPNGNSLQIVYTPNTVDVPKALENNNTYNTSAKIISLLRNAVMARNTSNLSSNIAVYELKLKVLKDGKWEDATADNFPRSGGITVTVPFPSGSQNAAHFTVAHMFAADANGHKAGEIEFPTPTKVSQTTEATGQSVSGVRFTVTGFSPVAIGWSDQSTSGGNNNNNNGNNNNNNSNNNNNGNNNSSSEEETYRIRVMRPYHGRVSVSHTSAEADETVTITVRPDSGYRVDTIDVTDSRDRSIRVRSSSERRYTFKMPARAVTVDVTFTDGSSSSTGASNTSGTLTPATKPVIGFADYSYLNCDGVTNCASRQFPDLNTAMWYHIPVDFTIRSGLMGAMGNGTYSPNATLTRAMLVQILYSHAGKPYVVANTSFSDVPAGAWYENAVRWAASQGIASGMGNGTFAPNAAITREQLAVMLYNYATRRGVGSVISSGSGSPSFSDSGSISAWARNAVAAMQSSGIIAGKAGGGFDPKGGASRAETAQMLWNLLR